ncbi:MAG: polysaccharide biosynthesis protein [Propionibacteriaceae bacterium]|nr:polysaccharide biosynthesis protein [Propionibacteriaceae bacterium]
MTNRLSGDRNGTVGTSGWPQFVADAASWLLSLAVTVVVLQNFEADRTNAVDVLILLGTAVVVQVIVGLVTKLYHHRFWTGSLEEAQMLVLGEIICGIIVCIVAFAAHLPVPVPVLATPITVCLSLFARYVQRRVIDRMHQPTASNAHPVLVYGAGDLGRSTVQRMLTDAKSPFVPIGFIDDDPAKRNMVVRTVPVLGDGSQLDDILETSKVTAVIVAIAVPPPQLLNRILAATADQGIDVKIVPTLERSMGRQTLVGAPRALDIEDLMEHSAAHLDMQSIQGYLRGKRVLITGAGGSIGSELCMQVHKLGPSALIMLDHDETHLQDTEFALYGTGLLMRDNIVLADIRDPEAVHKVFELWRPEVVFHTAALKHVPMLQRFPQEAWDTNVMGTLNLLQCAREFGVEAFINISTDKAAAPTTILGHSKRMAEHLTSWAGQHASGRYVSVRFGNVFGSRGSMVPLFRRAIDRGIPITLTHEDATRYFMTISEACQLVIAAGASGHSGDVMILKMGSPVRIRDIAMRLMEIAGKQTQIDIVGVRPGEKIHEVLTSEDDDMEPTTDAQGTIRAHVTPIDPAELDYQLWHDVVTGEIPPLHVPAPLEMPTPQIISPARTKAA